MDKETILQVSNLHVSFHTLEDTVQIIRGVNFDLKKGETLAIVGESGSGKSVLAQALMGLLTKNFQIKGDISYKKWALNDLKEEEWNTIRGKEISMVFQDPLTSLDPTMKIGLQIAEPLIRHQKIKRKEALKYVLEMMKKVGFANAEKHINDYPYQWSGGMRQRAVLAMALITKPEILIADEPTTALDATTQLQILHFIKEKQKNEGSSTIFITHDLGVVAGIADRVAVMYAGKIVESGTVDEIFYNPQHPYTWQLLDSLLSASESWEKMKFISETPVAFTQIIEGDAFAPRNMFALDIDFEEAPPLFQVSQTHYAATWLLDSRAPKVVPPESILRRWEKWALLKERRRK
ncbi:di-tripeptide transporter ATP-binding protein [Streptococcus macacae NCTC 11558]|uniref:Oligopeptide ABC transporter, ATP-binding protein OppD n=1 Tax=Streptococcus macacae NCTC 11558 TaxID=764298 RepID=G5JW95_9STRE|nr:ABC transporter ATP-binding protein [Streptococcus macacae]EHJ52578.1 oligopeptide ABC transporter, ATP-binding protein OppD [Streptococcus macacae NCTC 11558]SUN77750.1 di-tripeptide transporter ATP-binding protein [Streptococcus macacae NCTC 11558]